MSLKKLRRNSPKRAAQKPVVGLEAEFTVLLDGTPQKPEKLFGTPRSIVRGQTLRRSGRSRHLPSGGALYFDTGVVEVATPVIEQEQACALRAARSLWEQIEFVRGELDAWEAARDCRVDLQGFSAHYNISFPFENAGNERSAAKLALLLAHLIPAPVMLLSGNRQSTGVGVRPRKDRIEVTTDFTPDPELTAATAGFLIGVISEVLEWPSYDLAELRRRRLPVFAAFSPRRHTSRQGWLARFTCYALNPFTAGPSTRIWALEDGRTASLREISSEIFTRFEDSIRLFSDDTTADHIGAVLNGHARSLLDFESRPASYEDVGREITWSRRRSRPLPRSAYEEVIFKVLQRQRLRDGARIFSPARMIGWFEIEFENVTNRRRKTFHLDELVSLRDQFVPPPAKPPRRKSLARSPISAEENDLALSSIATVSVVPAAGVGACN